MHGVRLYFFLVAVAMAAFLISLDSFIINVALTTISGELGVRRDVGTWLITLFTMANTLCVPLAGRLAGRFGDYAVFQMGVAIFCLSSWACGASSDFSLMLVFRVFQGAGGGLILPVSLTLILSNFPPEKRSVAIGFWSFFVMVGPAMGPMVGGWLSDEHWRWMFFVNLPFGAFIFMTMLCLFWGAKEERERYIPDLRGFMLLAIGIGALQVALNRGQVDDWFRSNFIIALFIISIIALSFFFIWEGTSREPFIEFSHFSHSNFTLASLTTGIGMGVIFSSFVLESYWVQEVLGYTPGWAGMTLMPVGLFPFIMYPLAGRIVPLLDSRIWVAGSFLLYACTFFWLSRINLETTFFHLALPRLVQGIGFPFFTIPNSLLAMQHAKKEDLTLVISLFSFMRMLFVGFAIALTTTLWIHREAFFQTRITSKTFANNPVYQNMLSTFDTVSSSPQQSYGLSYDAVIAQAQTLGLADIYYLFGWIFLGLCIPIAFYRKKTIIQKEQEAQSHG